MSGGKPKQEPLTLALSRRERDRGVLSRYADLKYPVELKI
jgi:hypothetical protein